MRALVWWPALNARQMFLKAQCVTLAGISRDVMEERADRRMFLVKVTEDEKKKCCFNFPTLRIYI